MPSNFSRTSKAKSPSSPSQESIELENHIYSTLYFSNKKPDSQLDPPPTQKRKEFGFGVNHSSSKIKMTKLLMYALLIPKALVPSKKM